MKREAFGKKSEWKSTDSSVTFSVNLFVKFLRNIAFLFFFLFTTLAENTIYAQWKNIAPGLITPHSNNGFGYGGMKNVRGKIIAAALGSPICISSDDGNSWNLMPAPYLGSEPFDLDMFDENNAIITAYSGMYQTQDGGKTWTRLNLNLGLKSGKYLGSPKDIVAGLYFGHVKVTHDGGITWNQITPPSYFGQDDIQVRKSDTTIYTLEESTQGRITSTKDEGINWTSSNIFNRDCYGFAIDECSNSIYVMHEGTVTPGAGNLGDIYASHDDGATFSSIKAEDHKYFAGNILVAPAGTLYVQTHTADGIIRSTDQGATWKSIGGPCGFFDSHLICCKDDNTLFAIDTFGSVWATFNSGGDPVAAPFKGSAGIIEKEFFEKDTIRCHDMIGRTIPFVHKGCNPPTIWSWEIIGRDSLSYSAGKLTFDSLHVDFSPLVSGDNVAMLILNITDGTKDTVELRGNNASAPFSYTAIPADLFASDSIYVCDQPVSRKLAFHFGGCLPKILYQDIGGTHAKDYTFAGMVTSPLNPFDSITIIFDPSDTGSRDALYSLGLDDGSTIDIPLRGYGIPPHPLFLKTSDRTTDTIGGSVEIPIMISGLGHAEDIDVTLHYGKAMAYHGSFSPGGIPLDIPNESWAGRSKLHIAGALPDAISGNALFDAFNDSTSLAFVVFDSVTVSSAMFPCQYLLPSSIRSTVTFPAACGSQILSRFLHEGTVPALTIIPNPAKGEISIHTTEDLGDARITIFDILGNEKSACTLPLNTIVPAKLDLPFSNGVYAIRVQSSGRTYDLRLLIHR